MRRLLIASVVAALVVSSGAFAQDVTPELFVEVAQEETLAAISSDLEAVAREEGLKLSAQAPITSAGESEASTPHEEHQASAAEPTREAEEVAVSVSGATEDGPSGEPIFDVQSTGAVLTDAEPSTEAEALIQ